MEAGLDELLDGGGTVGTLESAIRYDRWSLFDLVADSLNALVMSSTEKLSLRGIVDPRVGSGIMSVIVLVCGLQVEVDVVVDVVREVA